MNALRGVGIGLGIGFLVIGALLAVYNAGRRSAEVPVPIAHEPLPPPALPPTAPAPPPPPRTPEQLATDDLVLEVRRLEALDPRARASELESWAPLGEPAFAALQRGTAAHIGRRSCYRGTVEEIHDVATGAELRVSLRGYGQDVIYVVSGTRPADDVVARTRVRVCGIHLGSYSYVSQAGWNITLPLLGAVLVERRR